MTNFERLSASPETLAAFLAAIPAANSPWEEDFHREFCHKCGLENCDQCPHEAQRNNPAWWLAQKAAESSPTEQEQNLNWVVLAIPEDCHNIFVCMDETMFDARVKNGLIPLHDDRNRTDGASVPCFIGYAATSDPASLDTLADLPTAKQADVAPKYRFKGLDEMTDEEINAFAGRVYRAIQSMREVMQQQQQNS